MKKQRNPYIEFTRFVGAIDILLHHTDNVFSESTGSFVGSYLFVEYLFMITGYFTTMHFDNSSENMLTFKSMVYYAVHKFYG